MYTCGPTVYGRPHIGNYSSFLMADLLRRWLEVGHRYKVTHVKNITDVGHLVADADTGEDKIEKQAREEHGAVTHESVIAIARKYEAQYLEDEKALNLREPEHRPRATEYIEQMKQMIDMLLTSGHAYVLDDGIYFDVAKFSAYGRLSGNTLDNLSAGARVEVKDAKRHPADFALWKFCVGQNEKHALRWKSPSSAKATEGKPGNKNPDGFPGWHIECSAMSSSLLGKTLDIHTGGEDNIFPHHECEIAQSESASGHRFVRYWLHKRRIDLAGEKMSKSLGNVLSVPTVIEKSYSALDLRFYLLSVHYRTNLKFSWKGMDEARDSRRSILEWMERGGVSAYAAIVKEGVESPSVSSADIQKFDEEFSSAMDTDLNVSGALAAVHNCMHKTNASVMPDESTKIALQTFIRKIRDTFGCFDAAPEAAIPAAVQELVAQRAAARASKDFKESDRLRDEIKKAGYEVRDEMKEQKIKKL